MSTEHEGRLTASGVYIPKLSREDILKYLQNKLIFINKLKRVGVDMSNPRYVAKLYQEADIIAGAYDLVIIYGVIQEAGIKNGTAK